MLVIPEDPVQNGYILKPLIEMVLAEAGKPAARVKVLSRPRLRGYDEIRLDWADVRCHSRLKEDVFGPLLRAHGNARSPGQGREAMTLASIRRRPSFFQLCPKMADLRDRIAAFPNPTA